MKKLSYSEIYYKLFELSKSHYYMSDTDKFGELDVYEWNDDEFSLIDGVIKPDEKQIYQDCESFSFRCMNALIDLYGEEVKENLTMMIGSWNGVGHGFFTFKAYDKETNKFIEYLWDNNLPCPLPLEIMLLTGDYKIELIYPLHKKKFYKVTKDPLLTMNYKGVKGSDILYISKIRTKG